jgi:xanthine dehydrogenase accessory factor
MDPRTTARGDAIIRDGTSAPTATAAEVFRLLAASARRGHRGVLATITGVTGTGSRGIGTHMAVLDNGDSAGSFSSGCVETAIVSEALDVLHESASRTVRFGQGSPYIDIRLPCGGGMDVLFLADPPPDIVERALACLDARQPVVLHLDPAGSLRIASEPPPRGAEWENGIFAVGHAPALRLVLLGHGAEMLASLRLACSFGAAVELYSPEAAVIEAGLEEGVRSVRLTSASSPVELQGDPWTAFLFLFHDHDWEPPLLAKALHTRSSWVGAMGSDRTQEARRAALAAYGVSDDAIARVRGPVGLIPSSRDPATLALSALAEIVSAYRVLLP